MNIIRLNPEHFGKFENREIELRPGINIIYGANEAGKSTLKAFIGAMLFGMKKKRGRVSKEDFADRYKPWDYPANYNGSMMLEHNGRRYIFKRTFLKNASSVFIACEDNGNIIADTDNTKSGSDEYIKKLIPELDENAYRNVLNINSLREDASKEYEELIRQSIMRLGREDKAYEGCDINEVLLQLARRKRETKKEIDRNKSGELLAYIEELEKTEIQLASEADEYKRAELGMQKASGERIRLLNEQEKVFEAYKYTKKAADEAKSGADRKQYFASVLFMLFGVIFSAAALKTKNINIGVAISAVVLCTVGISTFIITKKTAWHKKNKYRQRADKLRNISNSDRFNTNEAQDIAGAGKPYIETDETENGVLYGLEESYKALSERILKLMQAENNYSQIMQRYKSADVRLAEINDKLKKAKIEYENAIKRKKDCTERFMALEIAYEAVECAAGEIHERLGDGFERLASEYACELTASAVDRITLDEALNISVYRGERFIPLYRLSSGTIAQVYLAVRLAMGEAIFNNMEIPYIFDDAFAFYDEDRLISTLKCLSSLNKQIIIFSCSQREAELLEKADIEYNYVGL